jgi:hypothetical protein
MASGWIYLARAGISSEVQRGMAMLSREGQEIGKVAALVVKEEGELAEEILLSRLPEMKGYWLVPVEWILSVCAGSVQLDLPHSKVAHLESWHAE